MFSSNLMLRPSLRNHSFDWMGDTYAPLIDATHFLGHSSLGTPWHNDIPLANIKRIGGESVFEIAVPGFSKEDLSVSLVGEILTIAGNREAEVSEENYLSKEFELRPFEIKFRLYEPLDLESARAEYVNGLLRLFFKEAKASTETRVRLINIA